MQTLTQSSCQTAPPPVLADIDPDTERFFVAHVKSRQEKAFADDLARWRVSHYLPLAERESIQGRNRRVVEVPLFPSYVFVRGDQFTPAETMATGRVCRTIPVVDQQKLLDQLRDVDRALSVTRRLDTCPFAVKGRKCRVTSGSLEGVEGVVIERGKATLILLEVKALGTSVVVEINGGLLEPAD